MTQSPHTWNILYHFLLLCLRLLFILSPVKPSSPFWHENICSAFKIWLKCQLWSFSWLSRARSVSSELLQFSIVLLYLVMSMLCHRPCSMHLRAEDVFIYLWLHIVLRSVPVRFSWLRSFCWRCIIFSTDLKIREQLSTAHGGTDSLEN